MKIALIFPGITKTGFNHYGFDDESSWIHHGLASISASLKGAGYAVELIDLRRLKGWDDFKRVVREKSPDIAGVTMMSLDYNYALRCVALVKEVDKKIITVAGGIHPSICPEAVLADKNVDYVLKGEGEISFVELVNRKIETSQGPKERLVNGIISDLDRLPPVDRDLFTQAERPITPDFPEPFVSLIVGRGCAYGCNFCQPAEKSVFGAKVRYRSADNVLAELGVLKKRYDFKSLMFHDDCLLQNIAWCREFSGKWSKLGYHLPFACQSRADIICKHQDTVSEMAEAGLKLLLIGFESGSQRVLDFLDKGTTVKENIEAARICRKNNIKIWANYMLGIPTETKAEVRETVRMLWRIKPDYYSPSYYTPHPGSNLYEYVRERDLSLIKNYESFRRNPAEPKIKGVDYDFLFRANFIATAGPVNFRSLLKKARQIQKSRGWHYLFKRTIYYFKERLVYGCKAIQFG